MIHPFLHSSKFYLFLCIFLTLSAGVWVVVSDPFFPVVALVENSLPYRFPVLGFVPPLWLLYFRRKKAAVVFLFTITPALFVTNLNMIRPDLFFVWLCLLTVGLAKTREQVYNGFLLILAGVYLWTGIHKLNWAFVKNTAWFLETRFFGKDFPKEVLLAASGSIPLIEIFLGLLCLSSKSVLRRVVGIALHAGILGFLLLCDWNRTMIPWSMVLLTLHALLSARFNSEVQTHSHTLKVPATIALILPALHFVGWWPGVFSWNMYSSRIQHITIPVSDELALDPPHYVRHYVQKPVLNWEINLTEWADGTTGGPYVNEPFFRERVITACEQYLKENP
jgi:hypothetical protein